LLGAALYDPLWTSAVRDATDVAIALVGFTMISAARLSVLYVVLWCVLASVLAGQFLP
jgi:chromate transporter